MVESNENCAHDQRKIGVREGKVPKPPTVDPNLESWEMCNSLVLVWIFNGLEKELQPSAAYAIEAKTLWDDLKERYSQGNEMRIFQLKSDISIYRQEGKTIQKFYSSIKTLWDELKNYLKSLGCSCDAATRYTARREKEKTYQFLMGLDEQFRGVWSDILRTEPLPSMSKLEVGVRTENGRGGQRRESRYVTTMADQDISRALAGLSMDNLQMEITEGNGRNWEAKGNKAQDSREDRGSGMGEGRLQPTLHRRGHQQHPATS
ncbi:hypothetical protein CRG98_017439 [Punica granatum]|uniref:Uncharacterized protein n=1 Tax=Punica granatum TaxID=22663 RepID=A0A2I0K2Y2_PUNGR|nr:hypothetical protein CRG98_017439 [Punica granatum]